MEAARRVTGRAPTKKEEKTAAKQGVNFNQSDLSGFNTEKKNIIRQAAAESEDDSQDEEKRIMKNLFVTNPDALEEFEREKEQEVEEHLGSKVKQVDVRQGWGEWAGSGVDTTKLEQRRKKAEEIRRAKIDELKKKRTDAKMQGVQVNTEDRDKKFVKKYMVKELPAQYQSTKQFETLMQMPVGKEWNTGDSYRRLIQPDLLVKAGSIIKPLRFKQDLKVSTIEKLVEHREKKKALRTSAKF